MSFLTKYSLLVVILIILGLYAGANNCFSNEITTNIVNNTNLKIDLTQNIEINNKLNPKIVEILTNTIKIVEGSKKYPYGIKSIVLPENPVEREIKARQICINTIVNNYKRWRNTKSQLKFLDYLGNKYCPGSDDRLGNINWKKNVKKISGLDF